MDTLVDGNKEISGSLLNHENHVTKLKKQGLVNHFGQSICQLPFCTHEDKPNKVMRYTPSHVVLPTEKMCSSLRNSQATSNVHSCGGVNECRYSSEDFHSHSTQKLAKKLPIYS